MTKGGLKQEVPVPIKYPQDYDTEAMRELDDLIRPSNYPGCTYYERKFQIPWDEN